MPLYIHFTVGQLQEMIAAGQQPGVPFQLGAQQAERAVGERRKVKLLDVSVNIRKNSVYMELLPDGQVSVNFSYDSVLPAQFSLYVVCKDRSDTTKLR